MLEDVTIPERDLYGLIIKNKDFAEIWPKLELALTYMKQ